MKKIIFNRLKVKSDELTTEDKSKLYGGAFPNGGCMSPSLTCVPPKSVISCTGTLSPYAMDCD